MRSRGLWSRGAVAAVRLAVEAKKRLGVRLVLSATGVAILALGLASSASASSDPWRDAAAQVNYPLYQPKVTLGFKPTGVNVQGCGDSGNTTVQALYRKGSGSKAPIFGFDEAYPQFCGNAGESMTVGSIDVNGVKVPVQVFCYGGTGCAVADGFANGFLLYLHQPGSKRTWIAITSRYLALDDIAAVVRSLTRVVPKPQGPGSYRLRWPSNPGQTTTYRLKFKSPHLRAMSLQVYGKTVTRGFGFDFIVACEHRGPAILDWDWSQSGGYVHVKITMTTGTCEPPGSTVAGTYAALTFRRVT